MGLLRLFLALSVIAGHAQTTIFGFNGIGAYYAVNFFFVISGFYMAMVLNEKYKNIKPIHFYKSRAFRLFPVYYIGLLIAIFASLGAIEDFFNHLSIGAKFFFIFQNLFIFGQDLPYLLCVNTTSFACASPAAMTINTPSWSLSVELCFYLIAPYILKSEKKTFTFVLLGCAYLLSINFIHIPLNSVEFIRPVDIYALNYYFYPSSFIFFGGGAVAYHLSKRNSQPHYFAAILAIILLSFTQTVMPFWHLLFIGLAVPVLFNYTAKNRLDRTIGELSYPAYILHFPIIMVLKPFADSHPQYFRFISLGSWAAVVSCVFGLLLYLYIEKRINKYRESKIFFSSRLASNSKFIHTVISSLLLFLLVFPFAIVTYVYLNQKEAVGAFNITDANWVKGVSKTDPMFFLENTPENFNRLRIGKIIKLANGEFRQILRVEPSGEFLHITLNGNPLDGEQVGFPYEIKIEPIDHKDKIVDMLNFTDENWIHGVEKNISAFLVDNTNENFDSLKVGKIVKLSNGDIRQIIRVDRSINTIRIYVNGNPLNGEQVGFPNKIEILR